MNNDKLINFIASKIDEIKYAIFYCHSNSPLHISNTIINSSKVDENGRIIFFIDRPAQLLSQFDQEFPVGLNYFQKGKNCFMNIFGRARIINDPEELAYYTHLSEAERDTALSTKILVVVHISKVDFYDTDFEKKNMLLKKLLSLFSALSDKIGTSSASYIFGKPSAAHDFGFL